MVIPFTVGAVLKMEFKWTVVEADTPATATSETENSGLVYGGSNGSKKKQDSGYILNVKSV